MLTVLAVLLLSMVVLLALPVAADFKVSWPETSQNGVRLRWAFGLVDFRLSTPRSKSRSKQAKKPSKKRRHSKRSTQKRQQAVSVVRQREVRQRMTRFAADVWRAVRKEDVRLWVCLGLGDPADTGQLWAVVGPVAGLLSNVEGASITIEPDFTNANLELDGSGSIQVIPLQLTYLVLALLLSPTAWRAMRQMSASSR